MQNYLVEIWWNQARHSTVTSDEMNLFFKYSSKTFSHENYLFINDSGTSWRTCRIGFSWFFHHRPKKKRFVNNVKEVGLKPGFVEHTNPTWLFVTKIKGLKPHYRSAFYPRFISCVNMESYHIWILILNWSYINI